MVIYELFTCEFSSRPRITLLAFQRWKNAADTPPVHGPVEGQRPAWTRYVTSEQTGRVFRKSSPSSPPTLPLLLCRFSPSKSVRRVNHRAPRATCPPTHDFLPDHRWLEATVVAQRSFYGALWLQQLIFFFITRGSCWAWNVLFRRRTDCATLPRCLPLFSRRHGSRNKPLLASFPLGNDWILRSHWRGECRDSGREGRFWWWFNLGKWWKVIRFVKGSMLFCVIADRYWWVVND